MVLNNSCLKSLTFLWQETDDFILTDYNKFHDKSDDIVYKKFDVMQIYLDTIRLMWIPNWRGRHRLRYINQIIEDVSGSMFCNMNGLRQGIMKMISLIIHSERICASFLDLKDHCTQIYKFTPPKKCERRSQDCLVIASLVTAFQPWSSADLMTKYVPSRSETGTTHLTGPTDLQILRKMQEERKKTPI